MQVCLAARVAQREQVAVAVESVQCAVHIADNVDLECGEQWIRSFKPACRVRIARDDYGVQCRTLGMEARQCAIEHMLDFARWMLAVEHISCNDERADLPLNDNLYKRVQGALLLVRAAVASNGLA